MEKPIRLKEVAKLTGFSEITLRRWLRRGWGPPYRKTKSGIYLFLPADVRSWFVSLEGPVATESSEPRPDVA